MRLATFQPVPKDRDNSAISYTKFNDYLGFDPVWCFPAETAEEFAFGWWYCSPSYPRYLVALDTEDYRVFDLVKWNQIMQDESEITIEDVAECFENVNPKYAEFVVNDKVFDDSLYWVKVDKIPDVIFEWIQGIDFESFGDYASSEIFEKLKNEVVPRINANILKGFGESRPQTNEILECLTVFEMCSVFSNLLYRLLYDEPVHMPYDYLSIPVGQVEQETAGMLRRMYDGELPFTYEYFDLIVSKFEEVMTMDIKQSAYKLGFGPNDKCLCGSDKKFKKCHGAGISVRPQSI